MMKTDVNVKSARMNVVIVVIYAIKPSLDTYKTRYLYNLCSMLTGYTK
jgi:hypothetical protein